MLQWLAERLGFTSDPDEDRERQYAIDRWSDEDKEIQANVEIGRMRRAARAGREARQAAEKAAEAGQMESKGGEQGALQGAATDAGEQ